MHFVKSILPSMLAIALFQSIALSTPQHEGHKMAPSKLQHKTILVSNGKYSPATINVKAGKPVHLMFKLGPNPGCGNVLVIEKLKIKKNLVKAKATPVTFTPKRPGKYPFTCGMGMYKGVIVVS